MGEGGKASTITLQIRVTEKTFNMNLPPYKFENTVFVKQQVFSLSLYVQTLACLHTHTHTRTHARARTHTHTHTSHHIISHHITFTQEVEDDGVSPRQFAHFAGTTKFSCVRVRVHVRMYVS